MFNKDIFRDGEVMINVRQYIYDPFTNYNYVECSNVSVSIKRTNANKCILSKIFLSKILKRFSTF